MKKIQSTLYLEIIAVFTNKKNEVQNVLLCVIDKWHKYSLITTYKDNLSVQYDFENNNFC